MIDRVIVPGRLALIVRDDETLAYNPNLNIWDRLDADAAEVVRWLRAGRARDELVAHLARRFDYSPEHSARRLREIINWCVLRRLLYLDRDIPPRGTTPTDRRALKSVYWITTQACNLRCTYCYQDATTRRPHELTTAEGKGLVDQAVDAGAETFIFTGGEPFSRRDLMEIARYSRDAGLRTNVITNGHFITPRTIDDVADTFDNVTVSLDHARPEHHDRLRGDGSWSHAFAAIELLLEAGMSVDVNSVLSRFGLRDVEELLRYGRTRRLGAHRITPQFPMGRGSNDRSDALTPQELLALNDDIAAANHALDVRGESRINVEGNYTAKGQTRSHCGAGLAEVSVDPEGWVYPCKLLQYPSFRTDNIRDKPLLEIVEAHPVLRASRAHVVDNLKPCSTCIIKQHCGGGCRGIHYSFTNEYTRAHPLFCAYLRRSFESMAWRTVGVLPPGRSAAFVEEDLVPAERLVRRHDHPAR